MLSDALSTNNTALSPRASVALLTLQLRAAVQAADEAEAAEAAGDDQAVQHELRSRVEPMLAERRAELERALTTEREAAAAKIAAARRAAEVMVSRAAAPAHDPPHDPTPAPTIERTPDPAPALETTPQPVVEPDQIVAAAVPLTAAATPPLATTPVAVHSTAPVNIGIDAEAFAHVFAAVFATMLDERLSLARPGDHHLAGLGAPPAPQQKGFWASALHVDVLLLGAAMVIMLIVLAAWLA